MAPWKFWSRDITAVLWAVQHGDEELTAFLVEKGACLEEKARGIGTPLHFAAMMAEHRIAKLLIDNGAKVDATAGCGQTVLHRAVIAGDLKMVELLVASGVDLEARDNQAHTATDWAAEKSRRDVLDYLVETGAKPPTSEFSDSGSYLNPQSGQDGLPGRIIDAEGKPLDGRREIADPSIPPSEGIHRGHPVVLETGIKPVDLFAPIKRGGCFAREFSLGGGQMLLSGQIIYNLVTRDDVRVVYIVAPEDPAELQLREYWMLTGHAFRNGVVFVVADPNESSQRLRRTVKKGFDLANEFRSAGYDVLVQLQGRLYPHADLSQLDSGSDENGSITTFFASDPPDGLSAITEAFDSEIYMSPHLASQSLYPAVDYQMSRSVLLEDGTFDQAHWDTVQTVRRRGYEFNQFNLASSFKKEGTNFLYLNEGGVTIERMNRTRRLGMFLTQGYHGTEMWTGKPGEGVPLSHTVEICQRILDGEYDDVPEKVLYMRGRVGGALNQAG